jgi:hypothetical protein
MFSVFWLNPVVYHMVSLVFHFFVVLLVFLLSRKVLRDFKLSVLAAFLFAILSSYHETIFWISSVGHIFSTMFVLLSILLFIFWEEQKKIIYFIGSIISIGLSLLFHELGVVAPLLILFYKVTNDGLALKNLKLKHNIWLFSPVVLYLVVRFFSNSHWFNGDYSYNIIKLPFNIIGNFAGYLMVSAFGPLSLSFYETLRNVSKEHLLLSVIVMIVLAGIFVLFYRQVKKMEKEDKRIIIFGIGFMLIALLPFLGLGNITSRYNYLVSFGFVILFAFFAKKLYTYLINSGRDIAISCMTLFIGLFFLLHIIQVQKLHGDWHEAGVKVDKFFVSIEGQYFNFWSNEGVKLNFVNVPIRNGEAWVFPVGLNDAVWFAFRSPKISVYQWSTVGDALSRVKDPIHEKVFLFDDQGAVKEQKKPKSQ